MNRTELLNLLAERKANNLARMDRALWVHAVLAGKLPHQWPQWRRDAA